MAWVKVILAIGMLTPPAPVEVQPKVLLAPKVVGQQNVAVVVSPKLVFLSGLVITNITVINDIVTLSWQGLSGVQVQRSVDNTNWADVGPVIGGYSTSVSRQNVSKEFYRLKYVFLTIYNYGYDSDDTKEAP